MESDTVILTAIFALIISEHIHSDCPVANSQLHLQFYTDDNLKGCAVGTEKKLIKLDKMITTLFPFVFYLTFIVMF